MGDRVDEPAIGTEREILLGWLAFHRDALSAKCAGLTPAQLVIRSVRPSNLTLLGLVRHLTEMELVPEPATARSRRRVDLLHRRRPGRGFRFGTR
jgi:hypothetical protein